MGRKDFFENEIDENKRVEASSLPVDRDEEDYKKALAVCKSLCELLPYPIVLARDDGCIVYKNALFKSSKISWRMNSSLRRYLTKDSFSIMMRTHVGEYSIVNNEDRNFAVLKIDSFFILAFVTPFESNKTHLSVIYDYLGFVPENRGLFESEEICDPRLNESQKMLWINFRSKFEKYYKSRSMCGAFLYNSFSNRICPCNHEVISILSNAVKEINKLDSCKYNLRFSNKNKSKLPFYIRCSTDDAGAIFGMTLYLALLFSCSEKSYVYVELERTSNTELCSVSFSVKTRASEKDLKTILSMEKYADERSLYFYTLKEMTMKYLWGFDVKKEGDKIKFTLLMNSSKSETCAFYDNIPSSSFFAVYRMVEFLSILLDI